MGTRILIVDDEREICELLATRLSRRDYDTAWYTSAAAALDAVGRRGFDIVVSDLHMAGINGLGLCERLSANHPGLPVVVMTAWGSKEAAVGALRAGAVDFIEKPFDLEALERTLARALRRSQAGQQVARLPGPPQPAFGEIIGSSPPMRALFEQMCHVVRADTSVLVTGESGTGKELVARALHGHGQRASGPFVAINCAAMPESLLESQLFGHVRGAFTGAGAGSTGLLVAAGGGTLFLDEIGDMPLALQPKLLRVLQERVVRPVGGSSEVPFDARLVASTNRQLDVEVAAGRFRPDLFFRINVIHLELPPLRDRGDDVLVLAMDALRRAAHGAGKAVEGIAPATAARLLGYGWPGNVRELQNCMERAVAFTARRRIVVEDLPERLRGYGDWALEDSAELRLGDPRGGVGDSGALLSMEEVERRHIVSVLAAVKGNKTLAARVLGLDRKTLYRRLRHYGRFGEDL